MEREPAPKPPYNTASGRPYPTFSMVGVLVTQTLSNNKPPE